MNSLAFTSARTTLLSLSLIIVLVFTGCTKSNDPTGNNNNPGGSNGDQVLIQDSAFSPSTLSVTSGTTVTWTNKDAMNHTVTSNTGAFDSGTMGNNATYSFKFTSIGSYVYHCNFHGGMTGTIVVN